MHLTIGMTMTGCVHGGLAWRVPPHEKEAIVQQKARYVDVRIEIFPLKNEDSPAEHSVIVSVFSSKMQCSGLKSVFLP